MNIQLKATPIMGATRTIRKFLFLPIWDEKCFRWLEFATMVEEYNNWDFQTHIFTGWHVVDFVE